MVREQAIDIAVRRAIPRNLMPRILDDATEHGWGMTEAIWHGIVHIVRRNFLQALAQ